VRAEIQLRRHDAVAGAVPREKRHALAAQRADHIRTRRIAKRRFDCLLVAVGELRHVIQTTASDAADGHNLIRGAWPLGLPTPLSRAPLSPARSVRVARSRARFAMQ